MPFEMGALDSLHEMRNELEKLIVLYSETEWKGHAEKAVRQGILKQYEEVTDALHGFAKISGVENW